MCMFLYFLFVEIYCFILIYKKVYYKGFLRNDLMNDFYCCIVSCVGESNFNYINDVMVLMYF